MDPKKNKSDKKEVPFTNPADEGLDHDLLHGDERDEEESYLDKQESRSPRGEDNEDTPDADQV